MLIPEAFAYKQSRPQHTVVVARQFESCRAPAALEPPNSQKIKCQKPPDFIKWRMHNIWSLLTGLTSSPVWRHLCCLHFSVNINALVRMSQNSSHMQFMQWESHYDEADQKVTRGQLFEPNCDNGWCSNFAVNCKYELKQRALATIRSNVDILVSFWATFLN